MNSRSLQKMLQLIVAMGIALALGNQTYAGGPAKFMMAVQIEGQQLEGQPLFWDSHDMLLMSRDGVYHQFPNKAAKNGRKIKRPFYSYTTSEMQNRLREEFGRSFKVSTTQHFVVVTPKGLKSQWSDRMESLYRTFVHSMRVRGIRIDKPKVPMVAIVFRSRADYYRYNKSQGTQIPANFLGHYDHNSNRVLLYDDGQASTFSTIVHEATHQTAFNVGVHLRRTEQPIWLVEGLAMMFETPGMREAWSLHSRPNRINHGRLRYFLKTLDQRPSDTLIRLVTSDQMFRTDPGAAYAEAWVLSFYLFETHSQEYGRYLARVANRMQFSTYSAKQRYADFVSAFGKDLKVLNSQLLRFVEELK